MVTFASTILIIIILLYKLKKYKESKLTLYNYIQGQIFIFYLIIFSYLVILEMDKFISYSIMLSTSLGLFIFSLILYLVMKLCK
jgi:hypothetical protein